MEEEAHANPKEEWETPVFATKKLENKFIHDLALKKKQIEKELKDKKKVLENRRNLFIQTQQKAKAAHISDPEAEKLKEVEVVSPAPVAAAAVKVEQKQ